MQYIGSSQHESHGHLKILVIYNEFCEETDALSYMQSFTNFRPYSVILLAVLTRPEGSTGRCPPFVRLHLRLGSVKDLIETSGVRPKNRCELGRSLPVGKCVLESAFWNACTTLMPSSDNGDSFGMSRSARYWPWPCLHSQNVEGRELGIEINEYDQQGEDTRTYQR